MCLLRVASVIYLASLKPLGYVRARKQAACAH